MLKKKKNKCIFNENWSVDPRFESWLKRSENKWTVLQKKKIIDISNIGISALTSHLSGQKHSEIASLRKSKLRIWLYLLVRFGQRFYGH